MKKLFLALSALSAAVTSFATVSYAGSEVEIHGFVSQGYIKSTKENQYPVGNSGEGSFNFSDYAVNFSKQLDTDLRVGLQLFAQDRGNFGDNTLTVDWAFGDYRYRDWLGARVGKVKIPLGLYNASRDNDALRNPIILPQGIYTDYYRDLTNSVVGLGLYGTTQRGRAGKLAYEVNVGTLPINRESALAKAMYASAMGSGPTYNYGLEWQTPVDGLRLAASGLWTEWTGTSSWIPGLPETDWSMDPWTRTVYSLEYVRNNLILTAEYGREDFDVDFGDGSPVQLWRGDSWYVGAAYRLSDLVEVGCYYNEYYSDRNNRDGTNHADYFYPNPYNMYQHDLALTLRLDPLPDVAVKFEAHMLEGTGLNWLQDMTNMKKDWTMFAAKVTYNF